MRRAALSSRIAAWALTATVIAIGVAGCGGSSTAPAASSTSPAVASGSVTVPIRNFMFQPQSLTVKVGTTVTWTNQDPQPTNHTATADSGLFNTGPIAPGSSVSYAFTTTGTYSYHCSIHSYMTATITVTR